MGQAGSSLTQFERGGSTHAMPHHQHLTGSGSQLSSSFSASFDCSSKIFDDDEPIVTPFYGNGGASPATAHTDRCLPLSHVLLTVAGENSGSDASANAASMVPKQKSVSITFSANGLLTGPESSPSSGASSFFKRHSAALQKRGKEKDVGKKVLKDKRRPNDASSTNAAFQRRRPPAAFVHHADSTTSENGLMVCSCGNALDSSLTVISGGSASANALDANLHNSVCEYCGVHNSVSLHNLSASVFSDTDPNSSRPILLPSTIADTNPLVSTRSPRKKSSENTLSNNSSRNSSRSNQFLLGAPSSASSSSLTPSPTAPSVGFNHFNYPTNAAVSAGKHRAVNSSPQKTALNVMSRRNTTGGISASSRQIITYCMENARGDLAGRVIGRMAHKRDDFGNFCANMNSAACKAFTGQLRDYLAEVARSLQSAEKIRELSMEFGRSQVSRRAYGFKADFFSIMADALTTECVFLDAATHQTTDAIEAWSELIGIMFSNIRDGYYQQIRYLRRNNTQALSAGPSSDYSIDNCVVPQVAAVSTEHWPDPSVDSSVGTGDYLGIELCGRDDHSPSKTRQLRATASMPPPLFGGPP